MMSALGDVREAASTSNRELELPQSEGTKESVVVVRLRNFSSRREYLKGLGLSFRDGTCPDVGIIAGKVKAMPSMVIMW